MKYTKGPWKLRVNPDENDRLRHLYFIDGPENGQPICEVRNYQKIGENNGSLIAAAPDAHALALHILAFVDDAYFTGHPEWEEIVKEARAVNNKVNGQ